MGAMAFPTNDESFAGMARSYMCGMRCLQERPMGAKAFPINDESFAGMARSYRACRRL